jgi:hypothetical protein
MTKLSQLASTSLVKLIYLGDSGTGKTGSLVSLVKAGYKLRILDFDGNLAVLRSYINHECPEKIDNVDAETVQDTVVSLQGVKNGNALSIIPAFASQSKAFPQALKLATKWSDDTTPSEWGTDTIFVIDSLTRMGDFAYNWAQGLNPSAAEPRTWYFAAQQAVEAFLAKITSKDFNANVIVITHVNYREMKDGTMKGWPSAIGSALGPSIPTYFPNMVLAETVGFGANAKRKIQTFPTGMIDLKTTAPFSFEGALDLGTGLATIFEKLKGTQK